MKRNFLFAIAAMVMTFVFAQDDAESKYIRNSLYMIRLDMPISDASDQESMKALNEGIDGIDWESRYKQYNSVALSETSLDWTKLPSVTQDEIDAVKKESEITKKLTESINKSLAEAGIKSSNITEGEYGARLLKYFKEKKFGNLLVGKWHIAKGANPENITAWDNNFEMIAEYGLKGLSAEAKENATKAENLAATASGLDAENKLLNNTYICVNRFGYMSAKEVATIVTAPLVAKLATAPGIAQGAIQKGIDKIIEKTKGYFICCNSYLFKLSWNDGAAEFNQKYWNSPADFLNNADYKIEYVGHTSKRINCLTFKSGKDQNALMASAALKGSDKCIAELQKEYDAFCPMTSLHVVDGKLAAYIGTKEGITEKSKFDVFQPEEKDGILIWKKIGSIKVDKTGVWDNSEKVEGEEDDETKAGNSLTCTYLTGKPGKMGEGCMIKQAK